MRKIDFSDLTMREVIEHRPQNDNAGNHTLASTSGNTLLFPSFHEESGDDKIQERAAIRWNQTYQS